MANISIRKSIQWLPGHPGPLTDEVSTEPSEPTSTLVLTSPKGYFVDVRILLPFTTERCLDQNKLDWAFGGTSSSETVSLQDMPKELRLLLPRDAEPRMGTWKHFVDSRTGECETVRDTGFMHDLADGTTLECGYMLNPAAGREMFHREVWESVRLLPTGRRGVNCAVMTMRGDDNCKRGMVIRLGRYALGIMREGGAVIVQKDEWVACKEGGEPGWEGGGVHQPVDELRGAMNMVTSGYNTLTLGKTAINSSDWDVVELTDDAELDRDWNKVRGAGEHGTVEDRAKT